MADGGGLLAGLIGGAAGAFGQHEDEVHAKKTALSDEEHQQQLSDKNAAIQSLQQKMSTVHPNSPEYADYQNQLTQAVNDRTALFHPDQPGGLHRLGELVWNKIHGTQPKTSAPVVSDTAVPGVAATSTPGMSGTLNTPALPGYTQARSSIQPSREVQDLEAGAKAPPQNPYINFRDQLKAALPNMSDEDLENAVQVHAGIAAKPTAEKPEVWTSRGAPFKGGDGKWYQTQFSKTGETRNQPMAEGYESATKTPTANAAVQRAEYAKAIGKKVEDLTFEDEQNMIRLVKQAGTPTTTTGRYVFVPQKDGSVKAVWTESTSSKSFGGKQPSVTQPTTANKPPKSAGEAKQKVATAKGVSTPAKNPDETASKASPGATVGGRATAPENLAKKNRDTAYNSFLDVQKASQDPTPVGDQGIILSWLRGRVNRVTATEIAAVNNLGGAQIALEGKIARIINGKMTNQQREWFLRSAKDNYENSQKVLGQYETQPGSDDEDEDFLRHVQ
jgi:hypothetical protein